MNTCFLTGTRQHQIPCRINKQANTFHRSLRRENPKGEVLNPSLASGKGGNPSSLRNSLCLLVALTIRSSMLTKSVCTAMRSISSSAVAVLM